MDLFAFMVADRVDVFTRARARMKPSIGVRTQGTFRLSRFVRRARFGDAGRSPSERDIKDYLELAKSSDRARTFEPLRAIELVEEKAANRARYPMARRLDQPSCHHGA